MFFMVDDQFPVNAKVRKAIEGTMLGELEGLAAMGTWSIAGAACQASLTDGRISRADLIRILLNHQLADQMAGLLVSAKLWHGRQHGCLRCPEPDEGDYAGDWIFHDWRALKYDTAEQVKTQRAKAKELKDPILINQVWARDCIDPKRPGSGRCRFCAVEVHRKTTVGPLKPEMAHVDPNGAFGVRNVVLSCRGCNQQMGRRTPEQAGMTLLPPPERPGAPTTSGPALVDRDEKVSRARGARDARGQAPGRVREGLGEGPGEGDGSGQSLGSPPAHPGLSKSARRRARKREREAAGEPQPQAWSPQPGMDAGAQDEVPTPGRFGSPWHGWRGPPSTVTETTCPEHGLEQPCRRCPAEGEPR